MVKKPNIFLIKFVSIFLSIASTIISKIIQAARSEITLFNTRAQSFVNIFTQGRKIVSSSAKHITSSLASCCDFSWLRRLTTTLSEKCVACVSALVRVDNDDSIRQHSQSVVRDSNNYTNNRHIIDQSKQCTAWTILKFLKFLTTGPRNKQFWTFNQLMMRSILQRMVFIK